MERNHRRWIWAGLAVLALLFLAIGIARGEVTTVFQKAVNICMECIGIG